MVVRAVPTHKSAVRRYGRGTKSQKWIAVRKAGIGGKPLTVQVRNREHLEIMHRDDRLYEKYAKPLEARHKGEFVAIGKSGEMIIGNELDQVFFPALERFGPRNFALKRIGYDELLTVR